MLLETSNVYIWHSGSRGENRGASVWIKVCQPGSGVWYSIALHSCATGAEIALGEDSDAILMTMIAEKLGGNVSLDDAFCTQEQAG